MLITPLREPFVFSQHGIPTWEIARLLYWNNSWKRIRTAYAFRIFSFDFFSIFEGPISKLSAPLAFPGLLLGIDSAHRLNPRTQKPRADAKLLTASWIELNAGIYLISTQHLHGNARSDLDVYKLMQQSGIQHIIELSCQE